MEEKNKVTKKSETEAEMKKRLRTEIMEEISEEEKSKKSEEKKASSSKKKSVSKKETEVPEDGVSKGSIFIMLVSVVLIAISIYFFPKIYQFILDRTTKPEKIDPSYENSNSNQEPVYEKITVNSPVLEEFTYPIMRNTPYEKSSYYQKESITMSDFSNNDILYNGFIYVHGGYISDYKGAYSGNYCGAANAKKMVKASYIDARIHNLFSKSTEYKHADFRVPSTNTKTPYVGVWKYDSKNNVYVYYGDCGGVSTSSIRYYDLKSISNAEGNSNNTVIEVTYQMGFAEVNTNTKQYSIYKDASMSVLLTSGTLLTTDYQKELEELFNAQLRGDHQIQSYKYTFSSNDCSYQDYCFAKGEWVK